MAARTPLLLLLVCVATAWPSARAQDLPVKTGPDDLEAEAKKLMEELPDLNDDSDEFAPTGEPPDAAVERTKGALERARKKQQRWEKLARQGVLSRAEAEQCVVEVADALARHERARVNQFQAQLTALQQRQAKGEAGAELVASAQGDLQSAEELCATAEAQARQTRLAHARTTLDRHKKLFAAGLVSRMQLQRAESNVRKLEAEGQEPAIAK